MAVREICIVVEGQTEEQFVKMVLEPLALIHDTCLRPTIVRTKQTKTALYKGGGTSWGPYRKRVKELAPQPHWARIGVMLDLYACPSDTPGYTKSLSGHQLHSAVTEAIQEDLEKIAPGRVLAGPILHELETLVIAAIATGQTQAEPDVMQQAQTAIRKAGGDAEMVNGGPTTAPSKRLLAWWPEYEKALYGPVLISQAVWGDIARQCPTFEMWWNQLLSPDPRTP